MVRLLLYVQVLFASTPSNQCDEIIRLQVKANIFHNYFFPTYGILCRAKVASVYSPASPSWVGTLPSMKHMKPAQPELANRMAGKSMPQLILASVLKYSVHKEPIKCQQPKNTSTNVFTLNDLIYSIELYNALIQNSTWSVLFIQNCKQKNAI